jgi:Transmembrane amino acid transporter protein
LAFVSSISGYYLFGDRVAGNVLNSFTYTDVAVAVVAASYLFKILFTYPMSNYPLRVTLHYLYRGETVTTPRQHVLETLLPFAIALVVGLFVRDVGFLFSFTGAIARTAIVFLYPCALAWKCDYSALSKGEVNEVIALGCLGVLVMVLGVWSSIQSVS